MNIEVRNCFFQYQTLASSQTMVLDDISVKIKEGEFIGIVGPTGSGKTTFLQQLNGLLVPTKGNVTYDLSGKTLSPDEMKKIRRKIGLVFQFPENQFFEETVFQEIAFGLKQFKLEKEEVRSRVEEALIQVGLEPSRYLEMSPFELSGGEKRRVAIACVLVIQSEVLVLDEPTAGLDAANANRIESILEAAHQSGKTVLLVSHDMDLIARLAKRVLVFVKGKILFDGSVLSLFEKDSILAQARLQRPRIQQYLIQLKESGLNVRTDLFTYEDAKNEIQTSLKNQESAI